MKISLFLAILLVTATAINAQQFIAEGRFPLSVIPVETQNVANAVISLNGIWEINTTSTGNVLGKNTGEWKKTKDTRQNGNNYGGNYRSV